MPSDFFQKGNSLFTPGQEKLRDGEESSENVNVGKQACGNPSKCKKNAQQTDCCSDYDTDESGRRNLNQIPEPLRLQKNGSDSIFENAQSGLDLYAVQQLMTDEHVSESVDACSGTLSCETINIQVTFGNVVVSLYRGIAAFVIRTLFFPRKFLKLIFDFFCTNDSCPVDEKEKTESPQSSADCFTLENTIKKASQLLTCSNIDSFDIETVELANFSSVSEAPIPECNKPVQAKLASDSNNSPTMFFGFTLYPKAFQKKYQQKGDGLSDVFLDETRHQILDGNVAQRIADMHNQESGNDSGIVLLCSIAGVSERLLSSHHNGAGSVDGVDLGKGLFTIFRKCKTRKRNLELIVARIVKEYPLLSEEELLSLLKEPCYRIDYNVSKSILKHTLTRLRLNSSYERFRYYVKG